MPYNKIQTQRLELMRAIAREMSREDAVLKGGTGLLLCYGLDRFSEDMDFDGYGKFDLERVKGLITKAFEKQKTKLIQVIVKKDTPTTKRLMFHYEVSGSPAYAYPLKIEFSFRQASEFDDAQINIIDGIKVYRIETLARKKFNAFLDRTAPRDIYDIAFLMGRYPEAFTADMLSEIKQTDPDRLIEIFDRSKSEDALLSNYDGTELICGLLENAEAQAETLSQKESGSEM